MFTLVIGGSASGKSRYAESYVASLDGRKIYLATMENNNQEAGERIERHRRQRSGLGFETLEFPYAVNGEGIPKGANLLLEDLGNLAANEMFGQTGSVSRSTGDGEESRNARGGGRGGNDFQSMENEAGETGRILLWIESLLQNCRHLTIVTNEVFSGGKDYEGDTLRYLETLAFLNRELACRADRVTEVVCSVPNVLKDIWTETMTDTDTDGGTERRPETGSKAEIGTKAEIRTKAETGTKTEPEPETQGEPV